MDENTQPKKEEVKKDKTSEEKTDSQPAEQKPQEPASQPQPPAEEKAQEPPKEQPATPPPEPKPEENPQEPVKEESQPQPQPEQAPQPPAPQEQPAPTPQPQPEPKPEEKPQEQPAPKPDNGNTGGNGKIKYIAITLIIIAIIAVVALVSTGFVTTGQIIGSDTNNLKSTTSPSENAVKVDFYVMSQCPYGTQVIDAIAPVVDKLGNDIDLNINFIANDLGDSNFDSLHGQSEVEGNIVQLCAIKHNPESYLNMLVCMNKNPGAIPGNWESCATENGLDVESIRTCYEGEEGKQLLSESIVNSNKVGATGSPTIFINDLRYSGGRGENDFLRAVCNSFEDRPEACNDIPEPTKVNAIILNDNRCPSCDVTALVAQLKSIIPGLEIESFDYSSEEGKNLYNQLGIQFLPAILFQENVKDAEAYGDIQNYLVESGDYLNLNMGANFDPNKEICDNQIDDNDNSLVDCDDSDCSGEFMCMDKLEKPIVELFVMSHCPYGTQTEKGIIPVVELLGDKIDFELKYVYYAMHGKKEVDEQLLQYCIQEEQNDKFIPYLKCFLKDGDTETCLTETNIDITKLEACEVKTDKEFNIIGLLEDQSSWLNGNFPQFNIHKQENDKYSVGGSPSLAVNGVKIPSFGRDPQSLLSIVCLGFENKPEECNQQLSAANPSPGFGFDTTDSGSTGAGCAV